MIFAKMTEKHVAQVAELEKICFGTAAWSEKSIASELNNALSLWIVAVEDEHIVSSCVCVIIPNLTHGQRPYALIENVITDQAYRGRGLAHACLDHAREIARAAGCYKIMLLTGSEAIRDVLLFPQMKIKK